MQSEFYAHQAFKLKVSAERSSLKYTSVDCYWQVIGKMQATYCSTGSIQDSISITRLMLSKPRVISDEVMMGKHAIVLLLV